MPFVFVVLIFGLFPMVPKSTYGYNILLYTLYYNIIHYIPMIKTTATHGGRRGLFFHVNTYVYCYNDDNNNNNSTPYPYIHCNGVPPQ